MRLRIIVLVLLALMLLPVIAVVAIIKSTDFSKYKGEIIQAAKDATGRELKIDGKLEVAISLSPALVIEGVSFANAPWGSRPEMAKVSRLEAQVSILPLLSGRVAVNKLIIIDPDILLETNAKGEPNWVFAPAAGKAAKPEEKPEAKKDGGAPMALSVEEVRLEKAKLTYKDGKAKKTEQLALDKLSIKGSSASSPLNVDIVGNYNSKGFNIAGMIGSVEALTTNGNFPLDITVKAGGAAIKLVGQIAKPASVGGIDVKASIDAGEIADLAALAEVKTPKLGPIKASLRVMGDVESKLAASEIDVNLGQKDVVAIALQGAVKDVLKQKGIALAVKVDSQAPGKIPTLAGGEALGIAGPLHFATNVGDIEGGYSLSALKLDMGKSGLTGDVIAKIGGKVPEIEARLAAKELYTQDFLGQAKEEKPKPGDSKGAGKQEGKKDKVFPADPLPLEGLKAANAKLDLKVAKLVHDKLLVQDLDVKLGLKDGKLTLPVVALFGGGKVNLNLNLDASSGKSAVIVTSLNVDKLNLGMLMKDQGSDAITGGPTDVKFDLRAQGGSVRELMAKMNGETSVVVGKGKIDNAYIDLMAADVLSKLASWSKGEKQTDLNCLVSKFNFKDGVGNNQAMLFDTSKMTVKGEGGINLATEELGLTITPKPKETSMVSLAFPVDVGGTFASPSVLPNKAGVIKGAAGLVAGALTGGAALAVVPLVTSGGTGDENPCLAAISGKGQPAQPQQPAKSSSPLPNPGGVINKIFGK